MFARYRYPPGMSSSEVDELLVTLGLMTEEERKSRACDRIFANMTRRRRGLRPI